MFQVVVAFTFLFSIPAQAHGICRMVPPNRMFIPDAGPRNSLSHVVFDQILDRLEQVYRPLFQRAGRVIETDRRWDDGTIDASASVSPDQKTHTIHLSGGFARHPLMTPDAFLGAACHEMGHHLGGAPMSFRDNPPWASGEGEADYYSMLKCMRLVLGSMESHFNENVETEPAIRDGCSSVYHDPQSYGICARSLTAARVMADVLASISPFPVPNRPNFRTPDQSIVPYTIEDYPSVQCRLDTYAAGALCEIDPRTLMSFQSPGPGSCDDGRFHPTGHRPHCWFNPQDPLGTNRLSRPGFPGMLRLRAVR